MERKDGGSQNAYVVSSYKDTKNSQICFKQQDCLCIHCRVIPDRVPRSCGTELEET